MIKLIVAIGPNNLIGNGNKMAWHIPEEFVHFKKWTIGHALLFGKNTFLGLPGKLKDRKIFVLSETDIDGVEGTIHSEAELLELFKKYKNSNDVLYIAGGKYVYETYYKHADELIISKVKTYAVGDVYINMDLQEYDGTKIEEHEKFDVWVYKKKNA